MLVVLSRGAGGAEGAGDKGAGAEEQIDPVRAGLLADYCFEPHPHPNLLPVTAYDRWDRLDMQQPRLMGRYCAVREAAIATRTASPSQSHFPFRPAIQQFLWKGSNLPYHQLAALELLETAQHYWEVDARCSRAKQLMNRDQPLPIHSLLRWHHHRPLSCPTHWAVGSSYYPGNNLPIPGRQFHRWQFG